MRATLATMIASWALAGSVLAMPKPVIPPPAQVSALPPGAVVRPVRLSRAVVAMKDGEVWQLAGVFPCSVGSEEFKWKSGTIELEIGRLEPAFTEELIKY